MEDDLAKIYQLADVFILISDRGKHRGEGVPLTPLEAASCGKPIIVGDEDGSQEAVEEGINGYIVSPKDPDGLKERVLKLYNDPALRSEMGYKARQNIINEFSYQMFRKRHSVILEDF
jgi:phosphatidylinositol alpha-1,6-mannosyltransferase